MRALVTGGAGLIGSHIVDELLKKGVSVTILDNLEPETHKSKKPSWVPSKCTFIKGDVRNEIAVAKALKGIDTVFHQAAYGGFSTDMSKYIDVNGTSTIKLFEIIKKKKFKIKKIVLASSQAVYGEGKYWCEEHGVCFPKRRSFKQMAEKDWEQKCPQCGSVLTGLGTDENKPLDPGHIYSVSKVCEEKGALLMGESLGIPTVALRYAMTYGPRQSLFNPYTGVCSIFSTMILNNLSPIVYEDGMQTRDFVFVEDVAKANLFVAENPKANFNFFNVCFGKPITVLEFVKTLAEKYKKNVEPVLKGEFRPGDVRHLYSDGSKLAELGFCPSTPLAKGIEKYVDWISSQGNVKEYFTEARKKMIKLGIVRKAKCREKMSV